MERNSSGKPKVSEYPGNFAQWMDKSSWAAVTKYYDLDTCLLVTCDKTSVHPENAMKTDIPQCNCTEALLNYEENIFASFIILPWAL